MVCVLPEDVCPYAKMLAWKPSRQCSTKGSPATACAPISASLGYRTEGCECQEGPALPGTEDCQRLDVDLEVLHRDV